MKPPDGKYQTAMKMNGLSPEIINVWEVDSVHLLEDGMCGCDKASDRSLLRGLRQWYGIEWNRQELGRPIRTGLPATEAYLQATRKGKNAKTDVWESDYPIVAMKRSNVRGAKGITFLCRDSGTHSPIEELEAWWKRN